MLSVIMPVYNVEKYIDKTITSILNQSYSDFELILVDDGSTDTSGKICDEYAQQDQRVRVFHKENGGVSSARNEGLRQFKGDFLTFIDSDDCVDPGYFYSAISILKKHPEIDVIVFGFNMIKNKQKMPILLQSTGLMMANEYIKKTLSSLHNEFGWSCPWNKVWRIRDKHNIIDFDETIYCGEDGLWGYQMLLKCNNVWLDNNIFYNYLYDDNSLSHSKSRSSGKRLNEIDALRKISLLDYPDDELQKLSYILFCQRFVYWFCEGVLCVDISSITDIYMKYKMEWNEICKYCIKKCGIKKKAEAVVCFMIGHTICNICRMMRKLQRNRKK